MATMRSTPDYIGREHSLHPSEIPFPSTKRPDVFYSMDRSSPTRLRACTAYVLIRRQLELVCHLETSRSTSSYPPTHTRRVRIGKGYAFFSPSLISGARKRTYVIRSSNGGAVNQRRIRRGSRAPIRVGLLLLRSRSNGPSRPGRPYKTAARRPVASTIDRQRNQSQQPLDPQG